MSTWSPASEKIASTPTLLLVFEASTSCGSVALIDGRQLVAVESVAMGAKREDQLFPAVQSLLAAVGATAPQLRGVVCGHGPGSFTSLRIAAALAKGLAHGASIPLFAVSSLLLAAADAVGAVSAGTAVVHGDALRGERYVLDVVFDEEGVVHAHRPVQRMTVDQLEMHAAGRPRLAVLSTSTPGLETRLVTPSSAHLCRVAPGEWSNAVPVESWEPQYGRLAEAQVKWEASHGSTLPSAGVP